MNIMRYSVSTIYPGAGQDKTLLVIGLALMIRHWNSQLMLIICSGVVSRLSITNHYQPETQMFNEENFGIILVAYQSQHYACQLFEKGFLIRVLWFFLYKHSIFIHQNHLSHIHSKVTELCQNRPKITSFTTVFGQLYDFPESSLLSKLPLILGQFTRSYKQKRKSKRVFFNIYIHFDNQVLNFVYTFTWRIQCIPIFFYNLFSYYKQN